MHSDALAYLKTQRVCVLAVEMPDGSPHAATVHFTYTENPLMLLIMTNPTYRKFKAFKNGITRASVVIGMSEEDLHTLQLDGEARLTDNAELQHMYYKEFPKAEHLFKKDVLFTFIPTWWKFTDWSNPKGKTVTTSDGESTTA